MPNDPIPGDVKIFGRDPATIIGLIQAAFTLLLTTHILHVTDQQAALIMAFVIAVFGVWQSRLVQDTLLSAIVTLAKVIVSLTVGFGFDLAADQVGAIIAFVTIAGGFILRTQTSPTIDLYHGQHAAHGGAVAPKLA